MVLVIVGKTTEDVDSEMVLVIRKSRSVDLQATVMYH